MSSQSQARGPRSVHGDRLSCSVDLSGLALFSRHSPGAPYDVSGKWTAYHTGTCYPWSVNEHTLRWYFTKTKHICTAILRPYNLHTRIFNRTYREVLVLSLLRSCTYDTLFSLYYELWFATNGLNRRTGNLLIIIQRTTTSTSTGPDTEYYEYDLIYGNYCIFWPLLAYISHFYELVRTYDLVHVVIRSDIVQILHVIRVVSQQLYVVALS